MVRTLLTIILFFAFAGFSCSNAKDGLPEVNRKKIMNTDLKTKLEDIIQQKVDEKNATPIEIKAVTDFAWDKLFIFTPYTPTTVINKTLGFESNEIKKVEMDLREEINLLVFVKDNKLVGLVEFPRRKGDFDKISNADGFSPETAKFTVTVEDRGESWITLIEAK
jgi:hypothetical protein